MLDLSVIILTYNEELHIRRCLENVTDIAQQIFVIDCFSTDKTEEIAKSYPNVAVLQNKWVNYATQFNWALNNAPIKTKWVLRLDADEYLTEELKQELQSRLPSLSDNYTGIILPLRRVFLGRTIRRGMPQVKLLRLFQYGKARSEVRQMDEHIQLLSGEAIEFKHEFADDNLNDLSWWTRKHVGYAIREAADLLDIEYGFTSNAKNELEGQAATQRALKYRYAKMPLFWRAFFYFCIRYFLKGGMLEGKVGFLWCFLQGWWYRTLVDALIFEIKQKTNGDKEKIRELLKVEYNIHL